MMRIMMRSENEMNAMMHRKKCKVTTYTG